jgi:Flp pilus assembly protein TadD
LLLLWVLVGLAAALPARHQPADEAEQVSEWRPLLFSTAVLALAASAIVSIAGLGNSAALLALLWLAAIVLGAGTIAALLPRDESTEHRQPVIAPRQLGIAAAGACLAVIALAGLLRYETAAIEDHFGLNQIALRNNQAALGHLQAAAASQQYEPQYRTELGGIYLALGAVRIDSAEPLFTPAPGDVTSIDPAEAAQLGRDQLYKLSELALQSARNLSPLDPDSYNNLGNLYLQWNRSKPALVEYRRAQALSHLNPRYLDQEALALLEGQHPRAARRKAESALALDRTFWYSYYTLAVINDRFGATQAVKQEATQGLYWVHNYWPPPPQSQIDQLRALQQNG